MADSVNPSASRSNMVGSCSVVGYANRDTKENGARGIRFYRIPVNFEKRRLWLAAIAIIASGRKDFDPSPDAAIYSVHFIGGKCMQKHALTAKL